MHGFALKIMQERFWGISNDGVPNDWEPNAFIKAFFVCESHWSKISVLLFMAVIYCKVSLSSSMFSRIAFSLRVREVLCLKSVLQVDCPLCQI